ncbi:hypothetical protein [Amycolatopsis tolypomycina]|uniref:hypothetical protein n=1 Tax=Amycolatopsis tolypomycina TaxID=208445 RepID=UPI000AA4D5B4|nr:hypothetical protein [Amycolatopsis tolypomycina]
MRPGSAGHDGHFPERTLAAWLETQGWPPVVHAFPRARPLREAYEALVDDGTDILLRGDESGLGTPEEDMAGLAAVTARPRTGRASSRARSPPRCGVSSGTCTAPPAPRAASCS